MPRLIKRVWLISKHTMLWSLLASMGTMGPFWVPNQCPAPPGRLGRTSNRFGHPHPMHFPASPCNKPRVRCLAIIGGLDPASDLPGMPGGAGNPCESPIGKGTHPSTCEGYVRSPPDDSQGGRCWQRCLCVGTWAEELWGAAGMALVPSTLLPAAGGMHPGLI